MLNICINKGSFISGQIFFALGGYLGPLNSGWSVMLLGRLIFGLGGESLAVAQNTYTCTWFAGSALNAVFGLQLSVSRAGSSINFVMMEPLFQKLVGAGHSDNEALGWTLWIAAAFCVMSLISAVVSHNNFLVDGLPMSSLV